MSAAQFLVINDLSLPGPPTKRAKTSSHNRKKTEGKPPAVNSRGSRSRSGCVTCRAKHSKCDETKPECLMCTHKGVKCGGYRKQLRWSYKHEVQPSTQASFIQVSNPNASLGARENNRRSEIPQTPEQRDHPSPLPPAAMPNVPEFDAGAMSWGMMSESLISDFGQFSGGPSFSPQHNWDTISDPAADMPSLGGFSPRSSFSLPLSDTRPSPSPAAENRYSSEDAPGFDLIPTHDYTIPPSITHFPSLLISHWFKDVCPVWSAYDSHMNLNRTMATALWPNSEAVSTSLQSMSAAFLATRLPYMKQTSLYMMKNATTAINKELAATKCYPQFEAVPMSLLFALFCLGTTMCWLDATQLGIPFLKEVKILLDRVNQQRDMLCEEDRKLLKFFNKSWIYCDMLLAVVSSDYGRVEYIEESNSDKGSPTCDEPARTDTDEMPHPWTGISTTASRLFTSAVRLCRDFRRNMNNRNKGVTAQDLRIALQQLEEAPKIEEQLLRQEYESMPHANLGETGDQNTPCVHLVKVAEAYRLAALLHLYQTFPDLVALRLPASSTDSGNRQVPWDDWIVPLTLRLVEILEQLPPESGSRMVQPLLCITASTGLRLTIPRPPIRRMSGPEEPPAAIQEELCDMTEYVTRLTEADDVADASGLLTQSSLNVGNARHFVLQRLNILESILPPKPIVMAKNLVQAIWTAYDDEEPGVNAVHWVDVMEAQNLRSFFG